MSCLFCRGSADATRQAHNLITALVKDPDKELDQIIPQLKNKVVSTNTLTMSTISMWNNMMANGIGTTATIMSGVNTSTTTSKIQGAVAKSTSAASVTQTATITSGRHPVTNAPRQESTLTNIGVWGAISTAASRTTNGRAANVSAPVPSSQTARSPGTVARQLFSDRQTNGTTSTTVARTSVTYSSPSMAKTKVVTASTPTVVSRVDTRTPQTGARLQQSAQKNANTQSQPVRTSQPQIPGLVTQNKVEPQPLPIKSTANVTSQPSAQAGPTGTAEYTPFNNFFTDVAGRVLGKKDETSEGRMNFASVAAAGVVATSSSQMPSMNPGVGAPRSQPNTEPNASLLAKAPGYKASGQQRTTSPQVSDVDYMKAPGFKAANHMNSMLHCGPVGGGPVEIDGGGRVPGYQPMPGGPPTSSDDYARIRLVDYIRPVPSPSGASRSPRSATSTPAGLAQSPRPIDLPHHKDQYSTPDQPMTLPKIESNLNPNAPDFTSRNDRAIFQQLSLAEQQQILRAHQSLNGGGNPMNHQQSLQSSFNSNANYNQLLQSKDMPRLVDYVRPTQSPSGASLSPRSDLSQSFGGRSNHPSHMMGGQNYGDTGLPQGGGIGLGDLGSQGLPLGGFGGAGYGGGGGSGNENIMSSSSIPRQYSPMAGPAPARSSSATSSVGTASNKGMSTAFATLNIRHEIIPTSWFYSRMNHYCNN